MITASVLLMPCLISRNFSWSACNSSRLKVTVEAGAAASGIGQKRLESAGWLWFSGRFEFSHQNGRGNYQDHRRSPAQSPRPDARDSPRKARREHRDERLGEVVARLRYALCRGAAAL